MTTTMQRAKECSEMWSNGYKKHPECNIVGEDLRHRTIKLSFSAFTEEECLTTKAFYTKAIEENPFSEWIGQYWSDLQIAEKWLQLIEQAPKYMIAWYHIQRGREIEARVGKMHIHPYARWAVHCGKIVRYAFNQRGSGLTGFSRGEESLEVFSSLIEMETELVKSFKGVLISSTDTTIVVKAENKAAFIGRNGVNVNVVRDILCKRIILT